MWCSRLRIGCDSVSNNLSSPPSPPKRGRGEGQGRGAAMRGLFFVGTDTGVGKTFVTAAVARALRRQGRPVCVSKPVATGAECVTGRWVAEDTRRLAEAAGLDGDAALAEVTPWAFPVPAAPPV